MQSGARHAASPAVTTTKRVFLFSSSHVVLLQAVALVGEYNNWDPQAEHWASRNNFGVWQLFLPDSAEGASAIPHRCPLAATAPENPQRKLWGGRGVRGGWAARLFGEE